MISRVVLSDQAEAGSMKTSVSCQYKTVRWYKYNLDLELFNVLENSSKKPLQSELETLKVKYDYSGCSQVVIIMYSKKFDELALNG